MIELVGGVCMDQDECMLELGFLLLENMYD